MRKGFTLVESLVAIVLLQFGLLAILATTALVARDLAAVKRAERARILARNRVETLRARRCPALGAETRVHPGAIREQWRVEAVGAQRVIVDSVQFALPRGRIGTVVARAATLCDE